MRTILICCICLTAGFSTSAHAAEGRSEGLRAPLTPTGPKIKVLLEKETDSALLEAKGPYKVLRKDSYSVLSTGKIGKRFVVHALQDGLRWGEEYPDVYQIVVIPASFDTTFFVNGIQYKGNISVYHAKNNKIAIVNEVSIEDYLKSTLAINSESSVSKEALAAVVIAKRSEAFYKVLHNKTIGRPWDVTAKEAKYYGYGVTYQPSKIERAVDATRFMVLESKKESEQIQNFSLDVAKAEDLANHGYDAKKILSSSFPRAKLSITINPEDIALR